MDLTGKTIALGICGGIAAYRACDFIRECFRRGAQRVLPLMTESAQDFVSPLTVSALSREPVYTDPNALASDGTPMHIAMAQQADVLLVMPATANFLAKMNHGIADDPLLTTVLTFTHQPVVIAPAMNTRMWENPVTQKNLHELTTLLPNVTVVPPARGLLACGEYGEGHLADQETILQYVYRAIHPQKNTYRGRHALVTAGGTREPLDPVRYLTNRSSGKMGLALADELFAMGAQVTLVTAQNEPLVRPYEVIHTTTAESLYDAVAPRFPEVDLLIMAAAVSDFRVADPSAVKIKKEKDAAVSIRLLPNRDILATLAAQKSPHQVVVGFAAESHDVENYAQSKLQSKGADVMVANDIARADIGFQSDENQVTLFIEGHTPLVLEKQPKSKVAQGILNYLQTHYHRRWERHQETQANVLPS